MTRTDFGKSKQAQFESVIDQAIIEALHQAQAEFEKAQIDEAISYAISSDI